MSKNKKIALLIDGDNAEPNLIKNGVNSSQKFA